MPTFTLNGNLVHFACYKNHIGFYPAPSGITAFKKELSVYKGAKGSVQFPIDKSFPFELVHKIVKFRVNENLQKAGTKKKLRTCDKGHHYYKSTDCPTCPVCEQVLNKQSKFFSLLSAPARRALENNNITAIEQLSKFTEAEILALHGIGPNSIPKLKIALKEKGLSFKK